LEQRLLVREVEIDRALGDAGALGHIVEPRALVAARGELLERGRKDRGAPGFGGERAAGAGAGRLGSGMRLCLGAWFGGSTQPWLRPTLSRCLGHRPHPTSL